MKTRASDQSSNARPANPAQGLDTDLRNGLPLPEGEYLFSLAQISNRSVSAQIVASSADSFCRTSNIQHPTSNSQSGSAESIGCWAFDVGCWMFWMRPCRAAPYRRFPKGL